MDGNVSVGDTFARINALLSQCGRSIVNLYCVFAWICRKAMRAVDEKQVVALGLTQATKGGEGCTDS
jgi:hypothetical protein